MSLAQENSQAQNAPGIDPFEHANTRGAADCVNNAFIQTSPDGTPMAAAMVDANGQSVRESDICPDGIYTNAVTVDEAIRTGLLSHNEVPHGLELGDIFLTFSDRPGSLPQKQEVPPRDPDNTSGDGDGKPNGERFGKQIPQGAEFQAEIPPTPTPAAVVENIGSPDLNLTATMNELAPGAYDQQIQYALGMLNIQNPQAIVEVNMNGYNFRNRVVYIDGTYYAFDKTLENPFVAQVGGTYFDIEEAFGIEHWVTIKGAPNIRPEPGTAQDNTPVGQAANGTRLRVVGEPKDDPDQNQPRDWVPILWDPDGDGNGEQGHVASDFTNGVEKVVRPDAVVREVTPEQALIESLGQFPEQPNMGDPQGRYNVRYSQAYLSENGLSQFTASPSAVQEAFNYILATDFRYATNNYRDGEQLEFGDEVAFITHTSRTNTPGAGDKISGTFNHVEQYVLSNLEYKIITRALNGEQLSPDDLQMSAISETALRTFVRSISEYIKIYTPWNGNDFSIGIGFFDESGTFYLISGQLGTADVRRNYSPALRTIMDGPVGLHAAIMMNMVDRNDTDVYPTRYGDDRIGSDTVYKAFDCNFSNFSCPAIREN